MSRRLFCFYGDDFTGSSDALEALASGGIRSVLFLREPDQRELAEFSDCQAIGLAGESRGRSPQWMAENLPAIFGRLSEFGAPLCQYKVCSTFDSSPAVGSIGKAIEIGREVFSSPYVPVVVAAPHLGRYVAFGNLFALGGGAVHRIDRHPTMSRHPVTPMDEGDLRLHLAKQTTSRISLLDLPALLDGTAAAKLTEVLKAGAGIVLFDGVNGDTAAETGRLLCSHAPTPAFAVGSSGLTHALIHYWRASGVIAEAPSPSSYAAVDRLIVVSGSCSPVTEEQIRWAMASGFTGLRAKLEASDCDGILAKALSELERGKSIVLFTALGPADRSDGAGGPALGKKLGSLMRELVLRSGVRRVLVAGGDTATHAVRELGALALTFAGLTVPGAPLCRVHSGEAAMDGLELVLKGGQIGPEDYFDRVRKAIST